MFFALTANRAPPASIATDVPASTYVHVRRDDEGASREAATAGAGRADTGAWTGFGCARAVPAGIAWVAAVPAAGTAVAAAPAAGAACDPGDGAAAPDAGGGTGTAAGAGAATRPAAATSVGASRMPAGGDSF